ncbi:hypothetical protein Fmac_031432 [Flemingia macrophylla]|uniref:Uncharacterized protein n=1 Tax=Flemingia macrophylla TaxID=520843 RepID=A0ABD1L224_9FABA
MQMRSIPLRTKLSHIILGGKENEGASLSPFIDIMKEWVAKLITDSFTQLLLCVVRMKWEISTYALYSVTLIFICCLD